ncbi:MAG: arginine--tRNA ligase [Bacteroidetes bacterium]|nr:arginine--tRNA ligase [Bacteroidota bacterium]
MITERIAKIAAEGFGILYNVSVSPDQIQIEKTHPEFDGDYTIVVFPLLRYSRKSPQQTAEETGNYLKNNLTEIASFQVVKGFLNLIVSDQYWVKFLMAAAENEKYGTSETIDQSQTVVEYSSPNTNKPLHLGHIRNNLLGYSIAEILKANGKKVIKVNLINDRGIHICKSMLAWMKWGNSETPASSGLKGDHLIGKYYVLFDKKHKEEIRDLTERGFTAEEAFNRAPVMAEAQQILQQWERGDKEIHGVWRRMNRWALEGFNQTYRQLGVDFDKLDYESDLYLLGKKLIMEGLEQGVFYEKRDGSVWVDLTDEGLDEKLLLRSDGTSVYITQDIGTAQSRYDTYQPEKLLYVVGNEQIYHFDVLKKVIKKLGRNWFDMIHHVSYGMVELPEGKMKSREGTVVDADDLMLEMFSTAKKTTEELGKTENFTEKELEELYSKVGLGALKYFILKVDPKKNMLFNPQESIDFNGNTGPFILYTYARIQSVIRKADHYPAEFLKTLKAERINLLAKEKEIIKNLYRYPRVVQSAGDTLNPAMIANFCYELAKSFNHYYQDTPILKRIEPEIAAFRIVLSWLTGKIIRHSCSLLGIDVPDRM